MDSKDWWKKFSIKPATDLEFLTVTGNELYSFTNKKTDLDCPQLLVYLGRTVYRRSACQVEVAIWDIIKTFKDKNWSMWFSPYVESFLARLS